MLTISTHEVGESGGFLAALAQKSCSYLRSLLMDSDIVGLGGEEDRLENIIVHTWPHLDEYFAELVFRLCLDKDNWSCSFIEQSIFSKSNDLACQHLWPSSAVLGIGGAISGGAKPLVIFDEHVVDPQIGKATRTASSCSELVIRKLIRNPPKSFNAILQEVNAVDEFGKAHPQHLGNLIKSLHEVRFVFKDEAKQDSYIKDYLTPDWKRAIIDACLAAVIYCLEDQVDLTIDPEEKSKILDKSLTHYEQFSVHRPHEGFGRSMQWIRSNFLNQASVFSDAYLKDGNGAPIKAPSGDSLPQLLILSRICFALERCWGSNIRDIVMTHFWEVLLQSQLSFSRVRSEVEKFFNDNSPRSVSPVGFLRKMILPPISLMGKHQCPLWLISIVPDSSVFLANRGIMNYINDKNNIHPGKDPRFPKEGCGLVLVQDSVKGTSALFKCAGVPDQMWGKLVDLIMKKEGHCWHVVDNPSGGIAPFIINGNKAHQYVPRTGLDIDILYRLVRATFY